MNFLTSLRAIGNSKDTLASGNIFALEKQLLGSWKWKYRGYELIGSNKELVIKKRSKIAKVEKTFKIENSIIEFGSSERILEFINSLQATSMQLLSCVTAILIVITMPRHNHQRLLLIFPAMEEFQRFYVGLSVGMIVFVDKVQLNKGHATSERDDQVFSSRDSIKEIAHVNKLNQLRLSVLRGCFMILSDSWRPPRSKLLVFVSSTFTDTHDERNVILEKILPRLRQRGKETGIEVTFIDMRWGVRDENTLDHMTWISCEKELLRCHNESAGLFFLSLQSEKYGYMPLPKHLPKDAFEGRMATWNSSNSEDELVALAKEWYFLEDNTIPPHYTLKNLEVINDAQFWSHALPLLSAALDGTPFTTELDLFVGRSVTEWEIASAIRLDNNHDNNKPRIRWLHRQFEGGVTIQQDPRKLFFDAHNAQTLLKLQEMKAYMSQSIPTECITSYSLPLDAYIIKDDNWREYMTTWERNAREQLTHELEQVEKIRRDWHEDGCGLQVKGEILDELLHHYVFAHERACHYLGHDDLLQSALDIIFLNKSSPSTIIGDKALSLECIHLGIIGQSGVGKSSFMAKLADRLVQAEHSHPNPRPVIVRFCGTTSDSSTGIGLVRSIIMQILILIGEKTQLDTIIPRDYSEAVKLLHELLNKLDVLLLIDAVDQLTDRHLARSRISFLHGFKCSTNTKIIISSLPDERDIEGHWIHYYGCETRLREKQITILHINHHATAVQEIEFIVCRLLERDYKKLLIQEQMDMLMSHIMFHPTMLFVKLAVKIVASSWSCNNQSQQPQHSLATTMKRLIHQIFDTLERDYGKELTRAVIGFLTFSHNGVNDLEMEDLLSLNETVLQDVFQYSTPNIRRLPTHVWLRLRSEMTDLLAERENGNLRWYHRQLRETAEERFHEQERVYYHELLGCYFTAKESEHVLMNARNISGNPLVLNDEEEVWSIKAIINKRRCEEGGYNLIHGQLYSLAVEELCNLEVILAAAKVGLGFFHVQNITMLQRILANNNNNSSSFLSIKECRKVADYARWLCRDMSTIDKQPSVQMFACIFKNQPPSSIVYQDAMQVITKRNNSSRVMNSFGEDEAITTRWILGLAINPKMTMDVVVGNVQISTREVSCLAMKHPNTGIIACGSADGIITIIDSITGEMIGSLEGHTSKVTALQWSIDGLKILSCSSDSTLRIWDPVSNEQLQQLVVGCGVITPLAISPCERYIALGGEDRTVRILSFRSLEMVVILRGHTGRVTCVQWHPLPLSETEEELVLASGSSDGTVRLWSPLQQDSSKQFLSAFPAVRSRSWVMSLAWENDKAQYLAVGRADGIVSIYYSSGWFQASGEALPEASLTLQTGSSAAVNCLAWHHHQPPAEDGLSLLLAVGHADGMILVWQLHEQNTASILYELNHHKAAVNDLEWSQRLSLPALSSVSKDGSLLIHSWDPQHQEDTSDDNRIVQFRNVSMNSEDDLLAVAAGDNTVRIGPIDACDNHIAGQTMSGFTAGGAVMSVAWHPSIAFILAIGTMDGKVEIWNATNRIKLTDTIVFDSVHIEQYTKQTDYRQLQNSSTLAFDRMVKEQQRDVMVMVLAWSFNGLYLAAGCDDSIVYVWSVTSAMMSLIHRYKGHQGAVMSLAWKADSTCLLSGSADGLGKMWQLNGNGQEFKRLQHHRSTVTGLCWAPVDKYIATCSADGSILIWDTESYQFLFGGTGNECPRLQYSILREKSAIAVNVITWAMLMHDPSCDRLWAALDNGELLLYSRNQRSVIISLLGHTDRITSIVTTKDGQQLLSASSDGSLLSWTAVSRLE